MTANLQFLALAGQAARSYLERDEDLSVAIAKLADEHRLAPMQIQRVVEATNHLVNDRLRKTASDPTFRFEVASLDAVLSRLRPPAVDKTAADLRRAVRDVADDGKAAKVAAFAASVPKPANYVDPQAVALAEAAEKLAAAIGSRRRSYLAKQAGVHADLRAALIELDQYALEHCTRGGTVADLHKFACNARRASAPVWDAVFPDVRSRLIKRASPIGTTAATEGISRFAKQPAIPKSDAVPYATINGGSPLLILLDTLTNKISDEDMYSSRLRLMDTHGPAIVRAIKSLRPGDETRKDLDERIYKLAAQWNRLDDADLGPAVEELTKVAGAVSALVGAARGAARVGAGAVGAATYPLRHPLKTVDGVRRAALLTGAVGALGAGVAAGRAARSETRSWRPAATRGVNHGGSGPSLL